MMWLLLLGLLMAAWVWNWNYLVLVNRNMRQKSDAIALAAAPELLDEDLLRDYPSSPTADQTNDFVEAQAAAEAYRLKNNTPGVPALRIEPADMRLTSGFVPDVTGQAFPFRFEDPRSLSDPTHTPPGPSPQHNTLYVECQRAAGGGNPVRYLVDNRSPRRAVDVRGGSFATLDNLVIGFQPTGTSNSPLAPIGILADGWMTERPAGPDNHPAGGNQIRELQLRLAKSPTDATDANAVLAFYEDSIETSKLAGQIIAGVCAGDLPPSGRFGPVSTTTPRSVPAVQWVDPVVDPTLNANLAATLNAVAIGADPRRVFPLYSIFNDTPPLHDGRGAAQLVGFVAATIHGAEVDLAHNRLTMIVEPCFVINHTAWTAAPNHASAPRRNVYVHKLRITH